MLLAIDIGNTHTVIGVYAGDSLRAMWRIATNRKAAADELRIVFSTLFSLGSSSQVRLGGRLGGAPADQGLMQAIKDATGARSLVCNAETAEGLFDADYPNPREIGADRVADAVAARALYGAPVVVVDFGTATNIEVIDRDGRFRGGVIAPGVQTSANALFTHGAQLPDIALVAPPAVIGTNTVEAIQRQHVGRGRPGGRAGAPHLRPAGLSGKGHRHGRSGAGRRALLEYHRRGEHRADAGRPAPYRRSRLPLGAVGRGCLRESPQ
ncbi:MAG: type III pantothenate kinase [Adlercreutzia sp.]